MLSAGFGRPGTLRQNPARDRVEASTRDWYLITPLAIPGSHGCQHPGLAGEQRPFVARTMSPTPSIRASIATSRFRLRRSNSPAVRRLCTPEARERPPESRQLLEGEQISW